MINNNNRKKNDKNNKIKQHNNTKTKKDNSYDENKDKVNEENKIKKDDDDDLSNTTSSNIKIKVPKPSIQTVLPPSFGLDTPYTSFDVYFHNNVHKVGQEGQQQPQGLGIKFKNIDEKVVVRGFAPWRITQYYTELNRNKRKMKAQKKDNADNNGDILKLDKKREATQNKKKKKKLKNMNDINDEEEEEEYEEEYVEQRYDKEDDDEPIIIPKEVNMITIRNTKIQVNDVIISVNSLDTRYEIFDTVLNKLKSALLSDLICIRFARPIINKHVIETLSKLELLKQEKEYNLIMSNKLKSLSSSSSSQNQENQKNINDSTDAARTKTSSLINEMLNNNDDGNGIVCRDTRSNSLSDVPFEALHTKVRIPDTSESTPV